VVYLTANADADTLERALATDPAGYLVKPYNPHSLRTTIEVAFRRHESEATLRRTHERDKAQFEEQTRKASQRAQRLRREATIDPLTGLYNRRHLEHVLKREISFAQREGHAVGIILLDLDGFKQLNGLARPRRRPTRRCARSASFLRSRLRAYDTACPLRRRRDRRGRPRGRRRGRGGARRAAAGRDRAAGHREAVAAGPRLTASLGVAAFPAEGTADGDRIVIEVRDTGPGIAPADLKLMARESGAGRTRRIHDPAARSPPGRTRSSCARSPTPGSTSRSGSPRSGRWSPGCSARRARPARRAPRRGNPERSGGRVGTGFRAQSPGTALRSAAFARIIAGDGVQEEADGSLRGRPAHRTRRPRRARR